MFPATCANKPTLRWRPTIATRQPQPLRHPHTHTVFAACRLEDDPNKVMFAAVTKGHGKGKIIGMLGVKRMKQICDELDQGGDFKCDKIFGTGASGTVRARGTSLLVSSEPGPCDSRRSRPHYSCVARCRAQTRKGCT